MVLSILFTAATAQGGVMIRYAPPVGSTAKYRLTNAMAQAMPGQAGGNSMKSSLDMTIKVLSRTGAKTTVETTTGRMHVDLPAGTSATMKKQIEDAGSGSKVQMVMDASGAIITAKSVGKTNNPMASGMGQGFSGAMQGMSFPNRTVRVGESWKSSLDMGKFLKAAGSKGLPPGMTINGVLPITTKLAAVRQQGGKTLAQLKYSMVGSMTMGMQGQSFVTKMNTTGESWIEVGTGVVHSMKTVAKSTTGFGGRSMEQKITTTMTKL